MVKISFSWEANMPSQQYNFHHACSGALASISEKGTLGYNMICWRLIQKYMQDRLGETRIRNIWYTKQGETMSLAYQETPATAHWRENSEKGAPNL